MKIAILTAYTKHNNWTVDGGCDFAQISSKNHIDYCYKNNYTYISEVYTENDYDGYHPTWIKLFALKKHLSNYDYVVWVDADCIFTNLDIKVENFIESDGIHLIVPKSEKDYTTNIVWTGITTGFIVMKNSETSYKLINYLLDTAYNYTHDYFHEQTVLDNYLRDNGYYETIPSLLCKLEDDLPDIHHVGDVGFLPYKYHRCTADGDYTYIYHAGGNSLTKKSRLESVLKSLC